MKLNRSGSVFAVWFEKHCETLMLRHLAPLDQLIGLRDSILSEATFEKLASDPSLIDFTWAYNLLDSAIKART